MPDEDIRDAFETLKRNDATISPRFEVPAACDQARWQWRPGVIAAAATSAAAAIVVLFLLFNLPSPDAVVTPKSTIAATSFEEYSTTVSRELFAASAIHWNSPSDFLLDFNTTLTTPEK